jgi:hypothetical protein
MGVLTLECMILLNFFKTDKLTLVYMASNLNKLVTRVDSSNGKILRCTTMRNECRIVCNTGTRGRGCRIEGQARD